LKVKSSGDSSTGPSRGTRGATGSLTGRSGTGPQSSIRSVDRVESPFQRILDEVLPPESHKSADLNQLWSELPGAEKALIELGSEENLIRYRNLVKDIVKATISTNLQLKKMKRRSRSGEDMELTVLRVVDERLRSMVAMLHSPRNSAFQLMKSMDEIRGLLLDVKDGTLPV
jgi:uncharacterized protein YaaR (DUF327 family)